MSTIGPTSGYRPSSSRPPTGMSRPWTAQSRPATARPQTAASARHEASYVVAVLEGRGVAREVGIAALDKDTGRVALVQLGDCPTYVKTLHQLHLHSPSLILVPDTFFSLSDAPLASSAKKHNTSLLVECLRDEFEHVAVEPVLRKYWNETAGLEFVNQLTVDDDERPATLVAVSTKYYALSALSALLKYAELRLNTRFAAASLRIRYVQVEGTMMIDPESARNLELIENAAGKKSRHSLFGLLNHTYTAMGARLLRVNILAPITVQAAIESRLDVVEELIQSEARFSEVKNALKALNKLDLDKLISSVSSAAARVTQMLQLRNVVQSLPRLAQALGGCRSELLRIVAEMISDERLEKIKDLVGRSLNDDAAPARVGGGLEATNARVYAVRANYNHLLDVARETYRENVGDIQMMHRELSQAYDLPLRLIFQDNGFVLSLARKDAQDVELPSEFVNVRVKKGAVVFETMNIKKKNARMKDALDETLILSDKIIQDLTAKILVDIGALYKASEAVALLDVLWSFAHASIRTHRFFRPEFTGTLAIKAGRHPVLENVQAAGSVVANDVYCCDASSFQVVPPIDTHGLPGKSTYLRQIGLLTVMAMCGCFVPAEYGSFRVHDALLTRLSNDDDMEKSLSTFANEMASSAMILGIATSNSLVLIDEVGRGTSPREGVGIAHALAEELIKAKSFVFFATHFYELTTTLSRQPSVVNLHLSVQRTRQSASNFGMTFQYRIVDGAPEDQAHYGLDLMRLADLPEDVLTEARRVATNLSELEAQEQRESQTNKVAIRRKALLRLKTQLTQALEHSTLPEEDLVAYLARLQKDVTKTLHETL
ncbi:hypothetical protein CERSUDRAFT_41819 [Gelatoporia subvermispora B]|uniref:DNA mismatch repair protein MSH3 n=1 Tax=Ceriporiopsis subvermispora (strain B) TaxID=914234 RepID=M2RAF6_CERS8|nr:hypothetical protein CERSUDRAFT_41819 [Gelatoporia subvermispora B]